MNIQNIREDIQRATKAVKHARIHAEARRKAPARVALNHAEIFLIEAMRELDSKLTEEVDRHKWRHIWRWFDA